jgi:hypothetical protein
MKNIKPDNGPAGTGSGPASFLVPGESLVQVWKGYHPSHESMRTSLGTRVLRGERNVGAPEPALLVLTNRRILILTLKGIFRRKYVLSESAPVERISQVETVGPYRTDVRIKGEWGYYSYVEFNRPIRVDSGSLEENGSEDPLGVNRLIMASAETARQTVKK